MPLFSVVILFTLVDQILQSCKYALPSLPTPPYHSSLSHPCVLWNKNTWKKCLSDLESVWLKSTISDYLSVHLSNVWQNQPCSLIKHFYTSCLWTKLTASSQPLPTFPSSAHTPYISDFMCLGACRLLNGVPSPFILTHLTRGCIMILKAKNWAPSTLICFNKCIIVYSNSKSKTNLKTYADSYLIIHTISKLLALPLKQTLYLPLSIYITTTQVSWSLGFPNSS